MSKAINVYVLIRVLLGLIFIVSGFEKLISPYQNFLYVIQSYRVLPSGVENIVALAFPWTEFILGIFLLLGFWLKIAMKLYMGCLGLFMAVVAQAILRHLPIDECGCFGDMISFPLPYIILLDASLFILACLLLRNLSQTSQWSLDQVFHA